MAGVNPQLFAPTLTQAPTANGSFGTVGGAPAVGAHHGLIGLVLLATLVLYVLHRADFRFAVTVGRS